MNCPSCNKPMANFTSLSDCGCADLQLCRECHASKIANLTTSNTAILHKKLTEMRVPKRYWNASPDVSMWSKPNVSAVCSFKTGVYFLGDSGVGKTYQMVGWLKYAILHGIKVNYINWSDFTCTLKSDLKIYDKLKADTLTAPVVFIDDFQVGNAYIEDYTFNFINTIYNEGITPFLTSINLPPHDRFAMRLGEMTVQYEVRN